MKITQAEKATERDVAYIKQDLVAMFNDFSESLAQSEINAQNNLEIHKQSINADFDGLKRYENSTHDKKWRKWKVVAGVASVASIVGLVAAGVITQNPTFYSPGNLIVGGLLPGVVNYFAAFSSKHQNKLKKIEEERQTHLDNVPFSQQALHDQKEIEVNKAWIDAISDELGVSGIKPEHMIALANRKMAEQGQTL